MDLLDCETRSLCGTCHHNLGGHCQLKEWLELATAPTPRPAAATARLAPFDVRQRGPIPSLLEAQHNLPVLASA